MPLEIKNDITFRGFSTYNRKGPPFTLEGIELIKQDLLNNFLTRRGERPMRPEYGTIIFDMLMEPFDDQTERAILNDVEDIVTADPRVQLVNMDVQSTDHTLQVTVHLKELMLGQEDTLFVTYQREVEQSFP